MQLAHDEKLALAQQIIKQPRLIHPDLHDYIMPGKDIVVGLNACLDDWVEKHTLIKTSQSQGIPLTVVNYQMMGRFQNLLYDASEPEMVDFDSCIVCQESMLPLSSLTDKSGKDYLTLGVCPCCGFVQQSRRPPRQWYADFYRKMWDPARRDPTAWPEVAANPRFLDMVRGLVTHGMKVLEIGTGYGNLLYAFKQAGFDCYGIEAGEHRAEFVRQKLGIPVFTGEAESAPVGTDFFVRESFDLIISNHVLEHVYDTRQVLEHLYPLLKPNGLALLSLPIHYQENLTQLTHDMSHTCSFSHANFLYLLQTIGFDFVRDFSTPDNLCVIVRKSVPLSESQAKQKCDWMKSFLPLRLLAFMLEKNGLAQMPRNCQLDLDVQMQWYCDGYRGDDAFLQMNYLFAKENSPRLDELRRGILESRDLHALAHLFPVRYVYPTEGVPLWYY